MMTADLMNALTGQKEAVLNMVRKAEDAEGLRKALGLLDLLSPVWDACGYRYKAQEVKADVRSRAWDLKRAEEDELPHYRKGTGLHLSTQCHIRQLQAIIVSL